ncbi:MAG: alpha-ribazole phosphatase, partial [Tannerellaceae bacterium]|nr:alpha-ribazole phosphatase [Tannerellaceae bacterium]
MNIYFVRHTSVNVPKGYIYGHTDVPLRETFEAEAKLVKKRLQPLNFDQVWCSPLSRCVYLATYCGYGDAIREERLKELDFGKWEMSMWDEISKEPYAKRWFENWIHLSTPGGEAFIDMYNRLAEFLSEIRQSGLKQVCLFTHGGILTAARIYAGNYPIEEAFNNIPEYGEVIK